jgi:hypothetical protein
VTKQLNLKFLMNFEGKNYQRIF